MRSMFAPMRVLSPFNFRTAPDGVWRCALTLRNPRKNMTHSAASQAGPITVPTFRPTAVVPTPAVLPPHVAPYTLQNIAEFNRST
jgi:hypothetical protein